MLNTNVHIVTPLTLRKDIKFLKNELSFILKLITTVANKSVDKEQEDLNHFSFKFQTYLDSLDDLTLAMDEVTDDLAIEENNFGSSQINFEGDSTKVGTFCTIDSGVRELKEGFYEFIENKL